MSPEESSYKQKRNNFVLKFCDVLTFFSSKAFDGMHEAVVERRGPSEPRSLRPDVGPHGGWPEADFGHRAVLSTGSWAKRRAVRLHDRHLVP